MFFYFSLPVQNIVNVMRKRATVLLRAEPVSLKIKSNESKGQTSYIEAVLHFIMFKSFSAEIFIAKNITDVRYDT